MLNLYCLVRKFILKDMLKTLAKQKASEKLKIKFGGKKSSICRNIGSTYYKQIFILDLENAMLFFKIMLRVAETFC